MIETKKIAAESLTQFSRDAIAIGNSRRPQTPALVLRTPDRAKGCHPLDTLSAGLQRWPFYDFAMNQPTIEERKLFWLQSYSQECFFTVTNGCDYLIRNADSRNESFFRMMSAGLLVTYAKPFTKCHGVGGLDEKMIPEEFMKTHQHFLDLRHKTVAHLDAINFQTDDKEFGNINQVRLKCTKDGFEFIGILLPLGVDEVKKMKKIATILEKKIAYHVEKFTKKYVARSPLKPGEYILNIDPNKPELFLPAKPLEQWMKFKDPVIYVE